MFAGIAFALAAGLMWGLVFVGPTMLGEYPAALLSFGRYLAFGLIALPLGWLDRAELARLTRADWIDALKLSAVGNLLYYLFLSSAIQRAGGPMPTMLIGTLPVIISICANLLNHERDGRLPWAKLTPALAVMLAGIACVNHAELSALQHSANANASADIERYIVGTLLTVGAVACWTWYPLQNANWLRHHPGRNPRAWATAQGLATLPLAALGYAGFCVWSFASGDAFPIPLGPRPVEFVGLMVAIGLFSSWLGTLCWNEASQRLPTAMAGQLIVFETVAALAYAYLLRWQWPEAQTLVGIGLLLVGVFWALRIKPVLKKIGPSEN
jgi:drug/metabolite transporter (DMT)-like permease